MAVCEWNKELCGDQASSQGYFRLVALHASAAVKLVVGCGSEQLDLRLIKPVPGPSL